MKEPLTNIAWLVRLYSYYHNTNYIFILLKEDKLTLSNILFYMSCNSYLYSVLKITK